MAGIRSSLIFSFSEKYISLIIQLIASMVVARLITPEQFGIFAVAFSLISFTQAIRDMGVNSYIIHKTTLSHSDVRACLFVTLVAAWLLASLIFFVTPIIARLYGDGVRIAVYVLLLNLIIMPISSTILAVLQREMRFDLLLRINLAATVANAGCSVALAASGWGFVSLAWASVASQLVTAAVATCCRPQLQHFMPSYIGARAVFRFGGMVTLSSLLSQVSGNIANLITAKFVTLEAMGLFSRSQSVSGLFSKLIMDAIHPLMLPLFSRLNRTDSDVSPAFAQTISYLAVVTWPFMCFLSLCAEPIIHVMFGDQWIDAALLLRLIAIGGLFWIIPCVANPLLVALGRVNVILRIQLINQVIAVVGVVVAAMHGIEAVALAVIPISAAHAWVWLHYATGVVSVRVGSIVRAACVAMIVTAMALTVPAVVIIFGEGLGQVEVLILAAAGAAFGWLAGVFLCGHPLAAEVGRLVLHIKEASVRWGFVVLARGLGVGTQRSSQAEAPPAKRELSGGRINPETLR